MFQLMAVFLVAGCTIWLLIIDTVTGTDIERKKQLFSISIFILLPACFLYYYWTNFSLVLDLMDLNANVPEE